MQENINKNAIQKAVAQKYDIEKVIIVDFVEKINE